MKQNLVLWKINKTDKTDKEKERRHKFTKSSVNRDYHCRCCRVGKMINKKTLRITLHTSVQSLGHVRLFVTPWTAAHEASLSITNSWSLRKLMSIELMMPSNHLILCCPLLLLPLILSTIKALSNESVLCIRWPKYWGFRFSIHPSDEYSAAHHAFL